MKFSAVLLSAASIALVAAQNTSPAAPATTAMAFTPEQQKCVDGCQKDLPCQAECLGAAGPSEAMVTAVQDCYSKCEQGDGSPEQSEKFASCGQACISEYYFASTLGSSPKTVVGDGSGSAAVITSTASDGKVATVTSASGASPTGDAANPSSSGSGADSIRVGGSLASIFAVVAAVFAL